MYAIELQPPNRLDPVSTRIERDLQAMLLPGLYAVRKIPVNSANCGGLAQAWSVAEGVGFGVPRRTEENNDGRDLHPDKQADDGREPAIDDAIGHAANVEPKDHVGKP